MQCVVNATHLCDLSLEDLGVDCIKDKLVVVVPTVSRALQCISLDRVTFSVCTLASS